MNLKAVFFQLTIVVLSAAVMAPAVLGGEGFELSWHTIDGGGAMRSEGDDFELSGTIGQPDAGVMAGDEFELTGGLWLGLPPTDCNDDGLVGLLDHKQLMTFACLTGPIGGPPDADCRCFDVNRDGTVDLADFAVMQSTYTGPYVSDQESVVPFWVVCGRRRRSPAVLVPKTTNSLDGTQPEKRLSLVGRYCSGQGLVRSSVTLSKRKGHKDGNDDKNDADLGHRNVWMGRFDIGRARRYGHQLSGATQRRRRTGQRFLRF